MKSFFKCIFVFLLSLNLYAKENIPLASFENIPDSSILRRSIAKTWFLQDIKTVEGLMATEYTDRTGKRFSVESIRDGEVLEVRITPYDTNFSRKNSAKLAYANSESHNKKSAKSNKDTTEKARSDIKEAEILTETERRSLPTNLVPLNLKGENIPQGTWILRRNAETGVPISITIYVRESSDVFLVLHPHTLERISDKSLIDFCIFSAYVRRDIPISFNFESLYYTSLVELKERTKNILPWEVFDPPATYSTVEECSKIVSKRMKELVYMEDGAFDENGMARYISTGKLQTKDEIRYASEVEKIEAGQKIRGGVNSFGFVKWVADGIIKARAGSATYIDALKLPCTVPNTGFTESFIKERELFFGLNWIRNLASACMSLTMKKTVFPYQCALDVKVETFSFSTPMNSSQKDKEKFAGYFNAAGYQIEYLDALLYYLAISEPCNFYLASINNETGDPALRQYNHVVAIFPYFDLLGTFHIDIYENARRTPIDTFISNNKGSFISLVRITAPELGFYNP